VINRERQYGKTTALRALAENLQVRKLLHGQYAGRQKKIKAPLWKQ